MGKGGWQTLSPNLRRRIPQYPADLMESAQIAPTEGVLIMNDPDPAPQVVGGDEWESRRGVHFGT